MTRKTMKKILLKPSAALLSSTLLAGCGVMGSLGPSSHSINYDTPQALIEGEFSEGQWVDVLSSEHLNPFSRDEAQAPYETLKKYCEEVQEGNFSQKEQGNPFYGQNPENIKQKTGLFECISSQDIWYARINTRIHKGPTRVEGAQGFYISASYVEPQAVAKKWADEKQKELKEFQRKEAVRKAFSFAASVDKKSGQKVCTISNDIGVIDKVVGNKIKVHVQGRVDSKPRGYFFDRSRLDNINGNTNLWSYRKKDEYIWSDSAAWGQCNFEL
jgi:hypothetical protein